MLKMGVFECTWTVPQCRGMVWIKKVNPPIVRTGVAFFSQRTTDLRNSTDLAKYTPCPLHDVAPTLAVPVRAESLDYSIELVGQNPFAYSPRKPSLNPSIPFWKESMPDRFMGNPSYPLQEWSVSLGISNRNPESRCCWNLRLIKWGCGGS